MQPIWVVMDCDDDDEWIVAAYDNESAATTHADLAGLRVVDDVVLRSDVSSDVVDTRAERSAEAELAQLARLRYAAAYAAAYGSK